MPMLLEARGLVKHLGGRRVVDRVDLSALLPTIDHMNLPVFLLVLPMGLLSSTYFPLEHPALVALNLLNPLYHLAQAFRGILLGGPMAAPLAGVAALSPLLLAVLVPLDLRLLRRRILGEQEAGSRSVPRGRQPSRPATRRANDMSDRAYGVVVVGAGVVGLAAAWHVLRLGCRPLAVVERFRVGHASGSSHGNVRVTRSTCAASAYVALMRYVHAEEWPRLERDAGATLVHRGDVIFVGPDHAALRGYQGGSAPMRAMHDYSASKFLVAHQGFSKLMEAGVGEGLVRFDRGTVSLMPRAGGSQHSSRSTH